MKRSLHPDNHPCFNAGVKARCGRVHLPVAPNCNIRCNYCNRKYDCANENRPGVTSTILTPAGAVRYLETVIQREPRITVAGIAGPGDPMADSGATLETMRLVKERFPGMLLCLATNGLRLSVHMEELIRLGITHVTVTVNALDPKIGERIIAWVRDGKTIHRGAKGAELLIKRQLEAIEGLKASGVAVKVNTVVVPGVNDEHVTEIARKMAELGVDLHNCMPMVPNMGTPFEGIPEPTPELMASIRERARASLPQMSHCARCRADAVGLIDSDRAAEFREWHTSCADGFPDASGRPYVAVASLEGVLVNQHLGEACRFQIWAKSEDGFALIEERDAPEPGGGPRRWTELAEILGDCRAVLASAVGETPRRALQASGLLPVEMNGFIRMGLEAVFSGVNPAWLKARSRRCGSGQSCGGDGAGC